MGAKYAETLAAALKKNNAGMRVLTVYWSWLESDSVAITCRDIGGEPVVTVEMAITDCLTDLIAAITTARSAYNGHWRLALPDGRSLEDPSGTRNLSELLRPSAPSMLT